MDLPEMGMTEVAQPIGWLARIKPLFSGRDYDSHCGFYAGTGETKARTGERKE